MKLDCINTEDGKWQIIDHDNGCKQIAVSDDVEGAWYLAACLMEKMINDACIKLST